MKKFIYKIKPSFIYFHSYFFIVVFLFLIWSLYSTSYCDSEKSIEICNLNENLNTTDSGLFYNYKYYAIGAGVIVVFSLGFCVGLGLFFLEDFPINGFHPWR